MNLWGFSCFKFNHECICQRQIL